MVPAILSFLFRIPFRFLKQPLHQLLAFLLQNLAFPCFLPKEIPHNTHHAQFLAYGRNPRILHHRGSYRSQYASRQKILGHLIHIIVLSPATASRITRTTPPGEYVDILIPALMSSIPKR